MHAICRKHYQLECCQWCLKSDCKPDCDHERKYLYDQWSKRLNWLGWCLYACWLRCDIYEWHSSNISRHVDSKCSIIHDWLVTTNCLQRLPDSTGSNVDEQYRNGLFIDFNWVSSHVFSGKFNIDRISGIVDFQFTSYIGTQHSNSVDSIHIGFPICVRVSISIWIIDRPVDDFRRLSNSKHVSIGISSIVFRTVNCNGSFWLQHHQWIDFPQITSVRLRNSDSHIGITLSITCFWFSLSIRYFRFSISVRYLGITLSFRHFGLSFSIRHVRSTLDSHLGFSLVLSRLWFLFHVWISHKNSFITPIFYYDDHFIDTWSIRCGLVVFQHFRSIIGKFCQRKC